MMDELRGYAGESFQITPMIAVRNPTLEEIKNYGEQRYFGIVHNLCSTPSDHKVAIWDALHTYWDKIDEYELFISTFQAIQAADLSILFGELDVKSFHPVMKEGSKEISLVNKDGAVINKAVHKLCSDYLRNLHGLKKNVVKPYDDYTRDVLIEADRDDIEDAAGKPFHSMLVPLISSLINGPYSKYTWGEIWALPIGVFMDSIQRTQKRDQYSFTMLGIYSGNVDIKKIDKKILDWRS